MNVSIIRSEQEFQDLSPFWDELYRKIPYITPFAGFAWNRTWWQHYGQGAQLFIVTIFEDGHCQGIAPLYITPKRGLNVLRLIGSGNADYVDFLFAPGKEAQCLDALHNVLDEHKNEWDVSELTDISELSPNFEALRRGILEKKLTGRILPTLICPFLELKTPLQELLNSRSKNFRYDLKRKLKKAEQIAPVTFEILHELSSQTIPFSTFAALYEKRWTKKDTNATIRSHRGQQFLEEVTRRWAEQGILKVPVIKIGENVAAFCLGFIAHQRFFYYIPSFDPSFNVASPGKLLIEHILKNFPTLQVIELDFMKGEEPYKLEWSSTFHQNYRVLLGNRRLKSLIGLHLYWHYYSLRNKARTSKILRWLRFNAVGAFKNILKKQTPQTKEIQEPQSH